MPENLLETVASLTPEQQDAVRRFIEYLRERPGRGPGAFLEAAEDFIAEHPELLRQLGR